MSNARYDGKPLLRLVELYVLNAIDKLPANEEKALLAMAPKLHALYKTSGEWHHAIEGALQMPPGLKQEIRRMWENNLEIARKNKVTITPQQFAEMFADSNYPL